MTMNPSDLKFDQLQTELLARIPELKEPVDDTFGTDYDLTKETPGGYPIFEDVVLDFLLKNLNSSQNANLLTRLFAFFERMATSSDGNVVDLLRIAILESLVYRPELYQLSRQYMGRRTAEFAELEQQAQNAQKGGGPSLN
jgi:hypothetical protein